jgi:hypothetical protein
MMNTFNQRWIAGLTLITVLCLTSCSDLTPSCEAVKADVQAKASVQGLTGIREQQARFWE